MTGSDVYMLGIVGSMMGALLTASQLSDGISILQAFMAAAKVKAVESNTDKPTMAKASALS